MNTNFWIDVHVLDNGIPANVLLDFNEVKAIVPSIFPNKRNKDIVYGLKFITKTDNDSVIYFKKCNSELEAQMLYAKFKKLLCTNEEMNEIL